MIVSFNFPFVDRAVSGQKIKSPKADKKGKEKTTWDPFMFGGRGPTGKEAQSLERGPKSPKGGKNGTGEDGMEQEVTDFQMSQFVPDASVIGKSSSKAGMLYIKFVYIVFSM